MHLGALRLQCLCSRCGEACAAALLRQVLFCTKEQHDHDHHLSSSSSRHLVVASSPPLFLSSGETFGLDRPEFLGRIQRLRFFFSPLLFFSSPPTTKPFYFNRRSSGGITVVIKRRKDYALDSVIQREKKVMPGDAHQGASGETTRPGDVSERLTET